eukprot:TRINITY_DN699_c0_g2_i1.p2 TRINITY_DN699_c0_g2~~TRINITY_DN699_c0_g2_i1.p2  ORF type:complete len:432 (-),score=139.98 TRINITY_DN699_c0_g2_i1:497-1792(-)
MLFRRVLLVFGVIALSVAAHAQESADADPLAGETADSGTASAVAAASNAVNQDGPAAASEFRDTSDFLCVMCQVFLKGYKQAGTGKEVEACDKFENKQEMRACQSMWWRHWGVIRPAIVKKEDGYDICAKLVHNMDKNAKAVYCEGGKTALVEVSADPVSVTARDESRQVIARETEKAITTDEKKEAASAPVVGHAGEHYDAAMHAWVETPTLTKEEIPEPKHRSCADVKRWNSAAKSGVYKLWMYNEAKTYKAPIEAYCEMEVAGGGWMLVRRAPAGAWHSATDKLVGTDEYGQKKDYTNAHSTRAFSMRYNYIPFSQYYIALGDKSDYMILDSKEFASQWGSGTCTQAPTVQESGVSKTPYQVLQCMRTDKFSDPILSTNCSQGGAFNGEPSCQEMTKGQEPAVIYAEGDSKHFRDVMDKHDGSNVFIR